MTELRVSCGIFGIGFLLFTFMAKVTSAILFNPGQSPLHAASAHGEQHQEKTQPA